MAINKQLADFASIIDSRVAMESRRSREPITAAERTLIVAPFKAEIERLTAQRDEGIESRAAMGAMVRGKQKERKAEGSRKWAGVRMSLNISLYFCDYVSLFSLLRQWHRHRRRNQELSI